MKVYHNDASEMKFMEKVFVGKIVRTAGEITRVAGWWLATKNSPLPKAPTYRTFLPSQSNLCELQRPRKPEWRKSCL